MLIASLLKIDQLMNVKAFFCISGLYFKSLALWFRFRTSLDLGFKYSLILWFRFRIISTLDSHPDVRWFRFGSMIRIQMFMGSVIWIQRSTGFNVLDSDAHCFLIWKSSVNSFRCLFLLFCFVFWVCWLYDSHLDARKRMFMWRPCCCWHLHYYITWKEAERRETKIKFEVMREAEEEKIREDSREGETKKRMEEKMGGQCWGEQLLSCLL